MTNYKLSNGKSIPRMGFGTFPQKQELIDSLGYAVACNKSGIIIDTSDDYYNQTYIRKAIEKNAISEDDIIICTKFSFPHMLINFKEAFEITQAQLGINKNIDIYLLHWPYPIIFLDIWREMEKIYKEGRVQAIGVCNCEVKHLKYLLKHCEIPPMVNEIEIHPLFQQRDTCEFCKQHNIRVLAYSPFARMDKKVIENEILIDLSKKYNKSVQQIILRWDYQKEYIALPSSKSKTHVEENYNILDFVLLEEEMLKIDNLDNGHRVRFNPNTYFTMHDKLGNIKKHLIYKFKTR